MKNTLGFNHVKQETNVKILGIIFALGCIAAVIAPFVKVFFSKQTEREMQLDLFVLMLLTFLGLPALGFIAKLLFNNDLAIGIAVILGLIGINIGVFKDKF